MCVSFIESINEILDSFYRIHVFSDEKDALFSEIKNNARKHEAKYLQENSLYYKDNDIRELWRSVY